MSESFLTHAIPPTRARLLLTAVVSVGIRFELPPAAEESSARAERLCRTGGRVDGGQGASVPAGRRHPLADPSRVLRLAADVLAGIRLEPFTSQQAQLSARWLRRSRHGPYIDLLQPAFPSPTPTPSSPSTAPTASGAASEATAGRPWRSLWLSDIELARETATVERSHRDLQDGTGLVRWDLRHAMK